MNPRRLYVPVVLGVLSAGGIAFYAAGRPWASAVIASAGLPPDTVSVAGTDVEPLLSALAIVVCAAALAVLASGPRLRRVVGALVVVVSVAAIWVAVGAGAGSSALDTAVRKAVEQSPAFTGGTVDEAAHTSWDLVTYAAFAAAVLLGALTAWFGPRWPTMGSRYDAPRARTVADAPESDIDMWKALDDGRDPTQ